jgi:hypothetical protein
LFTEASAKNKNKFAVNRLLSWTFVVLPRFLKRLNAAVNPLNFDKLQDSWLYLMTRRDREAVTITSELIAGEHEIAHGCHRLSHLTAEEEALLNVNDDDETAIEALYAGGRSGGSAEYLERAIVATRTLREGASTQDILAQSQVTPEDLENSYPPSPLRRCRRRLLQWRRAGGCSPTTPTQNMLVLVVMESIRWRWLTIEQAKPLRLRLLPPRRQPGGCPHSPPFGGGGSAAVGRLPPTPTLRLLVLVAMESI